MEEVIYQADLTTAPLLLKEWLTKQASKEALSWLEPKLKSIVSEKPGPILYMTFSSMPDHFAKDMLKLSNEDLKKATSLRKHWQPYHWSLAQTARSYLLLAYAQHQLNFFKDTIDKLLSAADIQELITIYQALPLFPEPEKFLLAATNGIRSNMQSVFDAIALNNPYPENYFPELAWNQLILKTLFVESPIQQVIGLKRRVNPALARALINTAKERFAANRMIKPELWAIIGFSTTKEILPLLTPLLEDKSSVLADGAILALANCSLSEANSLMAKHPDKVTRLKPEIEKLREFSQRLL
jgi:hypothetical protein